jgi:glycosyl hydrolase family 12/cellulose binding protein with CBM2 domain
MLRSKRLLTAIGVASSILVTSTALTFLADSAQAATTTLCNSQTAAVSGGAYTVQNNEWNSSAAECVTTDGSADFTVANSSISNATNGAPGGYPAIYKGCHWGACSSNSGFPIQVGSLGSGKVTTSWSTTQTGAGAYDVAYDIWFNQQSSTSGQPNAEELMIWLNHNGSVQPSGSVVASNVSIGGHTYNVWEGQESSWIDVSYVMTSGATSVSNLDIGQLASDSVSRGFMNNNDYLIDVEAGFELWQGGAGLAANSFAVNVNGSGPTSPPTTAPPTTAPPTTAQPTTTPPTTTPPGSASCSATYSLVNSWTGGYQAQVVVKNTGSASTNSWNLSWTYPGDQKINNLWNGTYTQSGASVSVTNAAYNGVIGAGSTTTVGLTATDSTTNTAPSSVACAAH